MKRGKPERNELVVCKITKIFPNSAFAQLLEYQNTSGMIHVSEVASRWVRDIREFLKENQYVVARVVGMDERGISLSMKRVYREESVHKLNEFKRERKADVMLEQIAKSMKKTKEQAYTEVGFMLQEEFGSLSKAFEIAAKNPDLFKEKKIPAVWEKAIQETAAKKFAEKTYELKGVLELTCPRPDGMDTIKNILTSSQKKGFLIHYVSAPRYTLATKGKDFKKLRALLQEEGEALVKAVKAAGGEGKFDLKE